VIAGSAKGRQLKLVPGETTRPIMDRVKESLFNIIGRNIYDAIFLDLFAGTGSVGIEALSRGAEVAYFYDLERKAIQTIEANLKLTRLESKAVLRRADAFQVLRQPPPRVFDFIYVAPPQYKGMWLEVLRLLDENAEWTPPKTEVIVQIDPTESSTPSLKRLERHDERKYGNTLLWFFQTQDTILEPASSLEECAGMSKQNLLETIANELIKTFAITNPPIPIEIMLQRPKPDMWEEVDITELSVGFLKTGGHFSPRMSLARLLARHIVQSEWGEKRGLRDMLKNDQNEELLRSFARMLIMPAPMVKALSVGARTPVTMSMHFEVPEDDAKIRLSELTDSL